ncbi:hypothetical protein HCG51_35270 (plasmid) [Tolypothrix sp. PCC 7910]|uniref:hypothetical protein n=1 Tax=Tolypothrix sp. PCC 7910 TaxID=2099387 RepID=UPI0014277B64|nr:hypothetical protein [Tolypothrix sp. PCC 7910]QIR41954.1 hypothetical protein HCG51_35270 [Tolypothrix sp. PCC 7910]
MGIPKWLGDTFGLQSDVSRSLVLGNLYGLVYFHLQDDLVDGDISQENQLPAIHLRTILYQNWLTEYVRLFEPSSMFWSQFALFMAQWERATARSNTQPEISFQAYVNRNYLELAERAAPLKICCVATCLLTQREHLIANLTNALDHLHVASVLLDHACDWLEDLEMGRYNTFIHYVSETPQVLSNYELNRRLVYEELWMGAAASPYFDLAIHHLDCATEMIETVECFELLEYVRLFKQNLDAYEEQMVQNAKDALHQATIHIFGTLSQG